MASGRPPFVAPTLTQLVSDILNVEHAPLQGCTPEFQDLVNMMLDKNPATRAGWKEIGEVQGGAAAKGESAQRGDVSTAADYRRRSAERLAHRLLRSGAPILARTDHDSRQPAPRASAGGIHRAAPLSPVAPVVG